MYKKPIDGITIYTKSGCSYCDKAKVRFPYAYVINCDKYLENKDSRKLFLNFIDTLAASKPRTFPMIFVDKKYKGGYDDVKYYFTTDVDF
jgi:glutaredoxin